jgi:DNA-binding CsgD family transcriptional regulator
MAGRDTRTSYAHRHRDPLGQLDSLSPLVAPLRAALADLHAGDESGSRVRAALDGDMAADAASAAAGAARLLEAVFDILVAKPTLLVVDDVHWADVSTLTLLDYIAHRADDEPIAVIAAARDDEPGVLRRLPIADGRCFLELPLERLPREGVREQISQLMGRATPESLVETIYERSAGNPLYVEELVSAGGAPTGSSRSLSGLVRARVAGLSDVARQVTDALAVLGTASDIGLVAAVAQLEGEIAAGAVSEAVERGVVRRQKELYALRHPLFGEALAEELRATQRATDMHRRAAEALASTGASAAVLAGHWAVAGDRAKTRVESLAAGDQALTSGAYAEARTHLERAASLWQTSDGNGDVLLRAAQAAWLAGDADDAVDLARRARAETGPRFDVLLAEAQYAWDAGLRDEAWSDFASVAESLPEVSPPLLRAQALWGLGRARISEFRVRDAHDLGVRAASAAAEAGSAQWQSHAWTLAGMARAWDGDLRSVEDLQRGVAFAEASGDPVAIGHAYQFLAGQLFYAGRLEEARDVALEGAARCDRLGLARSFGTDTRATAAGAMIELGLWRDADAVLEGAEPRAVATGNRALLAARRGEWDVALRSMEDAQQEPTIGGPGRLTAAVRLLDAELAWLRNEPQDGLRNLRDLPLDPGVWGIDQAARMVLWLARLGQPSGSRVVHLLPAMTEAMNAELTAVESGSEAAWRAAAEAWQRLPRPYEFGITALEAADAAYARGDRPAGKRWIQAVLATAQDLGAAPLLRRAEALAKRARIVLAFEPRDRPGGGSLTPREEEVLELLAEGRTNPQIAQHLFISPKTVGIHVQRVLEKMDAHTRGEAVAAARRRGLLS